MLACTDDLEQGKRFGGWKSDAVHAYLYAVHAAGRGRASDMLRSKPILSSSQRVGSQPPTGKNPAAHRPGSALGIWRGGYPPVGGHPPGTRAMAEAKAARAVTTLQMKTLITLIKEGKDAYKLLGGGRPEEGGGSVQEHWGGEGHPSIRSPEPSTITSFGTRQRAAKSQSRRKEPGALLGDRLRGFRLLLGPRLLPHPRAGHLANGSASSRGNGMEPMLRVLHGIDQSRPLRMVGPIFSELATLLMHNGRQGGAYTAQEPGDWPEAPTPGLPPLQSMPPASLQGRGAEPKPRPNPRWQNFSSPFCSKEWAHTGREAKPATEPSACTGKGHAASAAEASTACCTFLGLSRARRLVQPMTLPKRMRPPEPLAAGKVYGLSGSQDFGSRARPGHSLALPLEENKVIRQACMSCLRPTAPGDSPRRSSCTCEQSVPAQEQSMPVGQPTTSTPTASTSSGGTAATAGSSRPAGPSAKEGSSDLVQAGTGRDPEEGPSKGSKDTATGGACDDLQFGGPAA